jgi:TRAP-type C4-dicarboxylate transport system permease small subunit
MDFFSRSLNRIINILTAIGFFALLLMMTVVVVNIVTRPIGKPIVGTYEAAQLLIVVMVAFSLSYAGIKDAHVNMDLIIMRVSKRVKLALSVITSILSLAIWILISWYTLGFANEQALIGERTSIMAWPVFPFRYILALGGIILCLVQIQDIIRAVKGLRGN